MSSRFGWRALTAALALWMFWAGIASSATITVINLDGPDEGFNETTAAAPVGGNTGTTRGQQRLIAFQAAADRWGALLNSPVEITVQAQFSALFCGGCGAVLGSAGPTTVVRDFAGAPIASTWYHVALANSLAGVDLGPAFSDIDAEFSGVLDSGCLAGIAGWYYGLDGNPPPNRLDFTTTLLHELAHGLGFSEFVDLGTGAKLLGFDDVFMSHLENHATGELYRSMTNAERVTASKATGDLHWTGARVVAASSVLSAGREPISGHVEMYAPDPQEPGSSVSHFSTSLTPDELMEPYITPGPIDDLTIEALGDVGWTICGDGVVDSLEGCDDGGNLDGDGCSSACAVEACWTCSGAPSSCTQLGDGTPCDDGTACTAPDTCTAGTCSGPPNDGAPCDDDNPCTENDVCGGGACGGSFPLAGPCLSGASGAGLLRLADKSPDSKDRLLWKWVRGTSNGLFGDPTLSTSYTLCVYDAVNGSLMAHEIPAGSSWRATGSGFVYTDTSASNDGINKVILKGGTGTARIIVRGKSAGLDMTALGGGLDLPLTVQLTNGTSCWEASYQSSVLVNRTDLFKAKSQ